MSDSTNRFYRENSSDWGSSALSRDLSALYGPFLAAIPRGGRILDLGCGPGRDAMVFSDRGFIAIPLDLTEELLRLGCERGLQNPVVGDMRFLPFAAEVFQGVWACASLLHLTQEDLDVSLREIRRILHPDGIFFLSVKQRSEGSARNTSLSAPSVAGGSANVMKEDRRFFAYYDEDELRVRLTRTGFVPLQFWRTSDSTGRPVIWVNGLASRRRDS